MINKPWYHLTLLIIILSILGIGFYLLNFKVDPPMKPNNEVMIVSFTIMPAELKDGWLMYKLGAKAVLVGKNLSTIGFFCVPTGTEVIEAKLIGMMKRVSVNNTEQWEIPLPINLMATNCYVEATSLAGDKIYSENINNIGYEE